MLCFYFNTEQVFIVDHLLPIGYGSLRDCFLTMVSMKSGVQTTRKETRTSEPSKCKQGFINFGDGGHFTILVHSFHFTDKETVPDRTDHRTSFPSSQYTHILHSKLVAELNKNPGILTLCSGLFALHC